MASDTATWHRRGGEASQREIREVEGAEAENAVRQATPRFDVLPKGPRSLHLPKSPSQGALARAGARGAGWAWVVDGSDRHRWSHVRHGHGALLDLRGHAAEWRRMAKTFYKTDVMKAFSTFVLFFAEVSKKGIPSESANSYKFNQSKPPRSEADSDLARLEFNLLLCDHVALVANKQLAHAFGRIPVNLLQPKLDIVE